MKMNVLVVNKESGVSAKSGKEWFKVTFVVIACPEMPLLIGKPMDKYADKEFYEAYEVNPTKAIEVDCELKNAFNPQFADLHLTVDFNSSDKNE